MISLCFSFSPSKQLRTQHIHIEKVMRPLVGRIVSKKMQKTVMVEVERLTQHEKLRRVMRIKKKIPVHDESSVGNLGDTVRIVPTRPISKTKFWRLEEVLRTAANE